MNTANTKRQAVKVAYSGEKTFHLIDGEGATYCGSVVKKFSRFVESPSLAAANRELATVDTIHICAQCISNRRMRGGE